MTQSEIYERVDQWRAARDAANDRLYSLITELRHEGATWVQLGNALGTSPQAVQQRFGHVS